MFYGLYSTTSAVFTTIFSISYVIRYLKTIIKIFTAYFKACITYTYSFNSSCISEITVYIRFCLPNKHRINKNNKGSHSKTVFIKIFIISGI